MSRNPTLALLTVANKVARLADRLREGTDPDGDAGKKVTLSELGAIAGAGVQLTLAAVAAAAMLGIGGKR